MKWGVVAVVTLCVRRVPADGTPVPKHVGVILIVNFVLWFVFYCILLSAFVGRYAEYRKMHGVSDAKCWLIGRLWTLKLYIEKKPKFTSLNSFWQAYLFPGFICDQMNFWLHFLEHWLLFEASFFCTVFTLTWPRSRLYHFIFHTRSEHKVPVHKSGAGCGSAWRSQRMYST